MSVIALVLVILGLAFLTLVWGAVLLSVTRMAWRGTFRATG